ncbi:DUF423 domain-containing protein [Aliikangiella maris]|uniref:DUF423 domain-containing protein n=2 Tax=Aliikangiella maris TaxID=3162458 RepID=A0ABV2BV91_9GAMM
MSLTKHKPWILIVGSGFALFAVLLGAFAAHALKTQVDAYSLGIFKTAVNYQMNHALGLLVIGVLKSINRFSTHYLNYAAMAMIAGILLFSGSLYLLALLNIKWFGAITPLGGLLFLIGWGLLIYALLTDGRANQAKTSD